MIIGDGPPSMQIENINRVLNTGRWRLTKPLSHNLWDLFIESKVLYDCSIYAIQYAQSRVLSIMLYYPLMVDH